MSSSKSHLDVFLIFFGVWRVDLGVFSSHEILEEIGGLTFRLIELAFHVTEKAFGEGVAIIDSEYSLEEVYVDRDVEILPGIVIG
jgi:hypothetical protein